MTFILKTAVRENVPLLIGLAGGTGSGKTLSAMKLAAGLSGGDPFAVIDTENGRAKAYADDFRFDHGEIHAPFRSYVYADAITDIDRMNKYKVILVDSSSHEHAGEGGMLDWQEEELREMVERAKKRPGENRADWELEAANNQRAWIAPKLAHKAYMTKLTQIKAHLILCFRAEPKTEQVKDAKGKTVFQEKKGLTGLNGWFPICEKNMPYELTASFLLMAERPGVPLPIKLMEKHRPFFPADKPITEEAGRLLGEWARGGAVTQKPAQPSTGGRDDVPAGSEPICIDCSKAKGEEVPRVFVPATASVEAYWRCPSGTHQGVKHSRVLAKLQEQVLRENAGMAGMPDGAF